MRLEGMYMATHGTLGPDEPSADEKKFVELWGDVDDYAESLTHKIDEIIARPEVAGMKPLIFYRQGMNAVNATLLLLRNGMDEPASGTVRLAFENLFCAAACNEEQDYFSKLEAWDLYEMERWEAALNDESSSSPTTLSTKHDKLSYKCVAKAGKISPLYEMNYRLLSKSGAHANTLAPLLMAYSAGGPLPELNLQVRVLFELKLCLEHFERQLKRLITSEGWTQPSPARSPESPDHPQS